MARHFQYAGRANGVTTRWDAQHGGEALYMYVLESH